MLPAARLGDKTATDTFISGPGVPTVLVGGMPAAVEGDAVPGNGVILECSLTVLIGGRRAARVTSTVGDPGSRIPTTVIVPPGDPTVLIGG